MSFRYRRAGGHIMECPSLLIRQYVMSIHYASVRAWRFFKISGRIRATDSRHSSPGRECLDRIGWLEFPFVLIR